MINSPLSKRVLHSTISAILLSQTNTLLAGTCSIVTAGIYSCSGAASSNGSDAAIDINVVDVPVNITTTNNFGIFAENVDTSNDLIKYASIFQVRSIGGTSFSDVHTPPSIIKNKSNHNALDIGNRISGDINFTSNAEITGEVSISNKEYANHIDITIGKVVGAITARNDSNTGHLNITTNDVIKSTTSSAIKAKHFGAGTLNITTNADVFSENSDSSGVEAFSKNSQINLTINQTVSGDLAILTSPAKVSNQKYMPTSANAATITINEDAFVHSIKDEALFSRSAATVNNHGRILGQVTLSAKADEFNNGTNSIFAHRSKAYLDSRNFIKQNTTDLTRNIQDKAVIDLGFDNDVFNNNKNGWLRVVSTTDETTFTVSSTDNNTANTKFNPAYSIAGTTSQSNTSLSNGVEHTFIAGVEQFNHAGTITMADTETGKIAPTAGDILFITTRDEDLQGDITGNFKSNGGELHLDTVLDADDAGINNSDVLILDNASLGTAPTSITVHNAGGSGAITGIQNTDGLMLVRVLGASDANTFVLENPVVVGNFNYKLVQADGRNWYLQSHLTTLSDAHLNIGTVRGAKGTSILLPLSLSTNNNVRDIQFDLTYDADLFTASTLLLNGLNTGSVLKSAIQISPNVIRITLNNQSNNLNNGELANLNLTINANTTKGTYPIKVNNVQAFDINGFDVYLASDNVQSGVIEVEDKVSTAILALNNTTALKGSTISIPINFSNNDAAVALDFDLSFDNSVFSVEKSSIGANIGTATIKGKLINDHTYHFSVTNVDLSNLNNGVLGRLNFKIDNNAFSDDYSLALNNAVLLSSSGGTLTPVTLMNSTVTIGENVTGDADGNGMIDFDDIFVVFNLITTGQTTANGDCDKDGDVDFDDIFCVFNIITNQNPS